MFKLLGQWRMKRRTRRWARRAVRRMDQVVAHCVLCGGPVTPASGHKAWPTGVWLHADACPTEGERALDETA